MELAGISPPTMNWDDPNPSEALKKFQRHVNFVFTGPFKGKSEEEKVSYLLLWIGEKGRDIHSTWQLSQEESKKLDTYFSKFASHLQPKTNSIFSRYKFYSQKQDSDTIDQFVTRLRLIAKECNFKKLTR